MSQACLEPGEPMIENLFSHELHQARARELHAQAGAERQANDVHRAQTESRSAAEARSAAWHRNLLALAQRVRRRAIYSVRSWIS